MGRGTEHATEPERASAQRHLALACADGRHQLGTLADGCDDDERQSHEHPRSRQQRHCLRRRHQVGAAILRGEFAVRPRLGQHTGPRPDAERAGQPGVRAGEPAGFVERLLRAEEGRQRQRSSTSGGPRWVEPCRPSSARRSRTAWQRRRTSPTSTCSSSCPSSPDATGGPPARFVWPHANDAREFLCGTNAMTDRRSFGYTFVPLDFAAHDGRQMHTTLSHELGHTLSLPDLYDIPEYSADVTSRITGNWDMMAGSRDTLPHFTLSNKMRMGWIAAKHLKLYNFKAPARSRRTSPCTPRSSATLQAGGSRASRSGSAMAGTTMSSIARSRPSQTTDDIPTDRRVVNTDVTSDTFTAPIARPPILFVRPDIDGDGAIIGTGSDLEEKDPGTQMDLKVEVVSTAADNAVVRVSYGSNGKPEPGIRPWTGGPNWQSPDIEVRNDKATADPAKYFNVPWLGHDNTVVAKVRNSGDLLAKGVVVDFFVTEYSVRRRSVATARQPTLGMWRPARSSSSPHRWNPSAATGKHYCVIVRIRLYQDPANLAIVDQNIYNNEARTNYTKFVSASASPSSRVGHRGAAREPVRRIDACFRRCEEDPPATPRLHRSSVAAGSRQGPAADPGLGRSPLGHARVGPRRRETTDRSPSYLWEVPNRLSIAGWAERPFEADCGAHDPHRRRRRAHRCRTSHGDPSSRCSAQLRCRPGDLRRRRRTRHQRRHHPDRGLGGTGQVLHAHGRRRP